MLASKDLLLIILQVCIIKFLQTLGYAILGSSGVIENDICIFVVE